jgi:hypothetical protein
VCPNYGDAIIEFECMAETLTSDINDVFTYYSGYSYGELELTNYKNKISIYQAITFTPNILTYNGVDYTYYIKKVKFEKNTYLNNYASGLKGILAIKGV